MSTRRALQTDDKRGGLAATRPGSALIRLLLALCGAGLLAGFFMRWMTVGDLLSVSGFGLMITASDAATLLSGSNRWLLILVPLFGIRGVLRVADRARAFESLSFNVKR